jgi:glycosyltransferase involved in cell wall biosynthesis
MLMLAYSVADVMAVLSRQDNLPNAASEAQACGTHAFVFDIGGLSDIVIHRETGWLAKVFDTADLAKGILWIFADASRWNKLSEQAPENAVARFSPKEIAKQYISEYTKKFFLQEDLIKIGCKGQPGHVNHSPVWAIALVSLNPLLFLNLRFHRLLSSLTK